MKATFKSLIEALVIFTMIIAIAAAVLSILFLRDSQFTALAFSILISTNAFTMYKLLLTKLK